MEPQTNTTPNILKTSLLELLFLVTLVTMILLTFNYFNIIPIYLAVPSLSFLPHQTLPQTSQSTDQTIIPGISPTPFQYAGNEKKEIILPSQTFAYSNKGKNINYEPLPNSTITINGKINIEVELFVSKSDSTNSKATNGFIFSNDKVNTPDARLLNIFYFTEFDTWTLVYTYGSKTEYYLLENVYKQPAYGKFTLTILDNGNRVIVTQPETPDKVFDLPESLYTSSKVFNSVIMTSPDFQIRVPSVTYYY